MIWREPRKRKTKPSGIIGFYIGAHTHAADAGMTWASWCKSSYNTVSGYQGVSGQVFRIRTEAGATYTDYVTFHGKDVSPDDVIVAQARYAVRTVAGSAT